MEIFNQNSEISYNSNYIDYSVIKEFSAPAVYKNFSVKYVVDGCEMYTANGNKYHVQNKEYLIANQYCEGSVEINSKKPVIGICIELAPSLLSEVVAAHIQPNTPALDIDLDKFFNSVYFLENKYRASQTKVGQFLIELDKILSDNPNSGNQFSIDFYYTLAEKIVEDHIPIYKQLHDVRALKTNTKKDLLRKMLEGKSYLESHFNLPVQIGDVAKFSGISEYHFFRLFKEIFHLSPHQYLIQLRLNYARHKIAEGQNNLGLLALECGFSDINAFSKSFKQHFGVPPSRVIN